MGIFHPTGVSRYSEGRNNSDYIEFRPYCAISAPILLPQKQRDAFLANMGMQTKRASPPESVHLPHNRIPILYVALAFLAMILAAFWRFRLL